MSSRLKQWLKSPAISPAGFLVRAAILALLYGLLTLCGLRSYMCVLSLTFPEKTPQGLSVVLCVTYLVSYFSFILGAPILVIGAGIFAVARPVAKRIRP